MKKKGISIVIGLVILAMGAAALEMTTSLVSKRLNVLQSADEYESEIEDKTNAEEIVCEIKNTGIEDSEVCRDLAEFFACNFITSEQQQYILELIKNGYDKETVKNVVLFWLDTDEDVSMIEKLLAEIPKDGGETDYYVTESAFDRLTENRSGLLTFSEGKEFQRAGVSVEDMIYANKLSKKGYMEIHDILSKCQNDGNINLVAAEVLSKCQREQYDFSSFTEEELSGKEASDIFAAADLNRGGIMSIAESFSSGKAPGELIEEIRNAAIKKISMSITTGEEGETE